MKYRFHTLSPFTVIQKPSRLVTLHEFKCELSNRVVVCVSVEWSGLPRTEDGGGMEGWHIFIGGKLREKREEYRYWKVTSCIIVTTTYKKGGLPPKKWFVPPYKDKPSAKRLEKDRKRKGEIFAQDFSLWKICYVAGGLLSKCCRSIIFALRKQEHS